MKNTNNSGFLGVSKVPSGYIARIHWDGKQRYLGCYSTAEQASAAYQQAKRNKTKKSIKPTAKQVIRNTQVHAAPTEQASIICAKALQAELRHKYEYHDGVLRARRTGKILGNLGAGGYITTGVKLTHTKSILVHRLVFAYHHGYLPEELDHIDTDRTNNRIKNLRPATRTQNLANSSIRIDNHSGYKGVHHAPNGWIAQIGYKRTRYYLGTFATAQQAAKAYNQEAVELFGQYARINQTVNTK